MNRTIKLVAATTAASLAFLVMGATVSTAAPNVDTGFAQPFEGTPRFEQYAAPLATKKSQINAPIGRKAAAAFAKKIGLHKKDTFTKKQFAMFVSGKGVGGDPASAKLVDESVRILTNTTGRPLYSTIDGKTVKTVLGSYGLIVNAEGMLESPANPSAPTRQVNAVLEPGGYMGTWAKANGAYKSILALYNSAFTSEAYFGNKAQVLTDPWELVPNTLNGNDTTVGMSMAPSIYIVNFALIYMLNPKLAAKMPAYWTPIPDEVVKAILASPTGQVPFSEYARYFPGATS